MARKTTITCDVCGKEISAYLGMIQVRYTKISTDPYSPRFTQNDFDFCSVECMAEYESNVGFEKER